MPQRLLAQRTMAFDSSGVRKVFDLAAKMKNPINLSIGQPDFDVDDVVKDAAISAIRSGKNSYAPTQGIAPLREKLQARVDAEYGHGDRKMMVTSGTSGGLVLAMMALLDPGDEVIFFDPFFLLYPSLVRLMEGTPVVIDSYPDFRADPAKIEAAITEKTKVILLNSPANPTGALIDPADARRIAEIAAERDIVLISDEIYRAYCFDGPFTSPALFNDRTLVIDGFSKSHAMTGWRLGFAHGPAEIVDAMIKLQQYTFVCAPQPVQWAGITAMDADTSQHMADYKTKRDRMLRGLEGLYKVTRPGGAFYLFPEAPGGVGSKFVELAIANELLVIPGNIFSARDTHFRISYAASDETLDRGISVLRRLAEQF